MKIDLDEKTIKELKYIIHELVKILEEGLEAASENSLAFLNWANDCEHFRNYRAGFLLTISRLLCYNL